MKKKSFSSLFWVGAPILASLTGLNCALIYIEIMQMEPRNERVLSFHFPALQNALSKTLDEQNNSDIESISESTPMVFLPGGEVLFGRVADFISPTQQSQPKRSTRHSIEKIFKATKLSTPETNTSKTNSSETTPAIIVPELFGTVGDLLQEVTFALDYLQKEYPSKKHLAVLASPSVSNGTRSIEVQKGSVK
jgi:hypothetical protein